MQTYSFNNVSLYVNGRSISDFYEGDDVITASRRNDAASDVVGADGKMGVAIHADKSGIITFRLKQTSSDAGFLYSLVNAAQAGSFTVAAVQVKDSLRNDLVIGTFGYILKPADMVRGQGINMQEWTIVVEDLQMSADETSGVLGAIGTALGF
jgi:hypothetical protein